MSPTWLPHNLLIRSELGVAQKNRLNLPQSEPPRTKWEVSCVLGLFNNISSSLTHFYQLTNCRAHWCKHTRIMGCSCLRGTFWKVQMELERCGEVFLKTKGLCVDGPSSCINRSNIAEPGWHSNSTDSLNWNTYLYDPDEWIRQQVEQTGWRSYFCRPAAGSDSTDGGGSNTPQQPAVSVRKVDLS